MSLLMLLLHVATFLLIFDLFHELHCKNLVSHQLNFVTQSVEYISNTLHIIGIHMGAHTKIIHSHGAKKHFG